MYSAKSSRASFIALSSKNQLWLLEERTKKLLLATGTVKRIINDSIKLVDIAGSHVGKIRVFRVTPYLLNWIKLRGIGWKPFEGGRLGMFVKELLHHFSPVDFRSVDNEDDLPSKPLSKNLEKTKELLLSDVVVKDLKKEIESLPLRGNGNPTNDRKPVMLLGLMVYGGLTAWRPSSSKKGLQHEASFVNKDDGLPFSTSVFLYSATSWLASSRPLLGLVLWPLALVSGSSSPLIGGSSIPRKDETLSRNGSRLGWRFFSMSTADPRTRGLEGLEEEVALVASFAPQIAEKVGEDVVVPSVLSSPPLLPSLSSDALMKSMPQLDLLPLVRSDLVSTASSLGVFAPLRLLVSLLVAYITLYMYMPSFDKEKINK